MNKVSVASSCFLGGFSPSQSQSRPPNYLPPTLSKYKILGNLLHSALKPETKSRKKSTLIELAYLYALPISSLTNISET